LSTTSLAGWANNRCGDGHCFANSENGFLQGQIDSEQSVLTPLHSGFRTSLAASEEGVKDVPKAYPLVPTSIVFFAFLRVSQHLIGVSDRFEFFLRVRVWIYVRVQLAR
jgi:hypothetical protein